jgi:tetratricopeptide (TPR) repeat protein
MNRFDESEALYKRLIVDAPNDPNAYNLHWQLGILYLTTEDLKEALLEFEFVKTAKPEFATGHGMYGWTLIKLGRFNKAEKHTKLAYKLDSTSDTYIMNHGHALLLQRKNLEARMYYLKALEHTSTQSRFKEGIIADFESFIENGWEEEAVKKEAIHLTNQWINHYKYKTIGNEYFVEGQALEGKQEYLNAGITFDSAIANERRGNFVRYGLLRNYYRWSAYNYYKLKDFETSLNRYMTCWEINLNYINDPELEYDDLQNISNVNDWLNNDAMEAMYDKMKYAARRKLQSIPQSNDLYFISIGTNGGDSNGFSHAAHDAKLMAEVIGERAQRIFDASYIYVLNQDVSDTVTKTFVDVIKQSRVGDCFILYYTGYTTNNNLIIGSDTIDNKQIVAWLSSMSASKKLLLIDAANSGLINQYTEDQADLVKDFQAESIGFIISDGRVELPKTTGSLFTSFLTSGITGKATTQWQSNLIKDTSKSLAYVTSKSLEGFMYGNMSSGNLQFDLKSYSSGVDFPLTYVNAVSNSTDTTPPMIYIPNVVNSDGQRGVRHKTVTISKNLGGQALDESGIAEIHVNGYPVAFSQNGKFNLEQNFSTDWTKLIITAKDNNGNISSDSFQVNLSSKKLADPEDLDQSQTYHALLFATNEYDTWDNLKKPISDVNKISTLLEKLYGFKVETQFNKTAGEMDSILTVYSKKRYASKDHLLVFFAGHGRFDQTRGGYIVGKNSVLGGDLRSYLRFTEVRDLLSGPNYGCKHTMLVLDVCYGGNFFNQKNATSYYGSSLDEILQNTDKWIKDKLEIPSAFFITSGSKEPVPDESQFALKFIETLETNGKRKGHILTFGDFTDNLQTLSLLPEHLNPTTPKYGTFGNHDKENLGGEFILIYKPNDVTGTKQDKKTGGSIKVPSLPSQNKGGGGAAGSKIKK